MSRLRAARKCQSWYLHIINSILKFLFSVLNYLNTLLSWNWYTGLCRNTSAWVSWDTLLPLHLTWYQKMIKKSVLTYFVHDRWQLTNQSPILTYALYSLLPGIDEHCCLGTVEHWSLVLVTHCRLGTLRHSRCGTPVQRCLLISSCSSCHFG